MTDDQTPKPKKPRHHDLPDELGSPSMFEGRPQPVDASDSDGGDDPFYSGMIGPQDRVDPQLDQWGRTEHAREAATPKSDNYDVGYGKPPKEHRFRPGQSGNPYGRPKRKRGPELPASLNDALVRELARKQTVAVGGKTKKLTMERVIAMRMVNALATCDPKMMPYWLNSLQRAGFPQAVEEMREREEEKMRLEHEARIKALENLETFLVQCYEEEPYDGHAEGLASARQSAAKLKAKGPKKPRY